MAKRKKDYVAPDVTVVRVEEIIPSYYASEDRLDVNTIFSTEEAILDIGGKIIHAEKRFRQHIGQDIEVSIVNERRLHSKPKEAASGSHFFGTLTLRKNQRSAFFYLPTDSLWEVMRLIQSGIFQSLELRSEHLNRSTQRLLSVHFANNHPIDGGQG